MRENCTFRLSGGRRRALQWAPPPTRQCKARSARYFQARFYLELQERGGLTVWGTRRRIHLAGLSWFSLEANDRWDADSAVQGVVARHRVPLQSRSNLRLSAA